MKAESSSFLSWVRRSLLGHTVLLLLLWIVPLVIVVAGVALFDGPLTLARLLVIIISATLGGIAVLMVGWYSIGARPSNRK